MANLPAPVTAASLKPPAADVAMEDAKSPATSVAGQKRRRDEEDDGEESMEEDSEGDAAMEEDSDDD